MKKLLIAVVSLVTLLAFFSSVLAIDRSPKKSEAKEKKKTEELKEGQKKDLKEGKAKGTTTTERRSWEVKRIPPEKLGERSKTSEKQKVKEKYDYFIDKNGNGIDDRLERRSKKPASPSAIRPAPKEKQIPKPAPPVKEPAKKREVKKAPKKEEVKKIEKKELREAPKKKEVRKVEKKEGTKKR
jgi:hypothetical protein